jgi:hypothetical protein
VVTAAVEHRYRYPFESTIERGAGTTALRLATDQSGTASPWFVRGALRSPALFAQLLLAVGHVARTRFFVPASMLARILREADPVVTSGRERLRFESFSACCGVYARLDLPSTAIDAEQVGVGTTNVDLGAKMREALGSIAAEERVVLSVGASGIELERAAGTVVERKVALPVRWLKGFVEVQATQAGMRPAFEIAGDEAHRFLRGLPRQKTGSVAAFVERSGKGLRLAFRAAPGAVPAMGIERLRMLEPLARRAQRLRAYTDGGSSAWELSFDGARFLLALSPEPSRGFSGEGRALTALAGAGEAALPRVRAALHWQARLDEEELAAQLSLSPGAVSSALAALGTRGLVGFDLAEGAYFHRALPFDLTKVEALHPRLLAARKLIGEGAVSLDRAAAEARVASGDLVHRVRFTESATLCTCPWFAKHRGERGPCKHVLAAAILWEGE